MGMMMSSCYGNSEGGGDGSVQYATSLESEQCTLSVGEENKVSWNDGSALTLASCASDNFPCVDYLSFNVFCARHAWCCGGTIKEKSQLGSVRLEL